MIGFLIGVFMASSSFDNEWAKIVLKASDHKMLEAQKKYLEKKEQLKKNCQMQIQKKQFAKDCYFLSSKDKKSSLLFLDKLCSVQTFSKKDLRKDLSPSLRKLLSPHCLKHFEKQKDILLYQDEEDHPYRVFNTK